MYPLKFNPILKERLWGGTRLKYVLGKSTQNENIGESWEVSGMKGNLSVVSNGSLTGKTLQELIDKEPEKLLGKSIVQRFGKEFPILIKFIDAREDLSIQLHPNDEIAKKRHNSFGKTEMWYVLDAKPNSNLILGFNKNTDKEEFITNFENGNLLNLLHYEKVKKGDVFFVNAGKIHSIGAGILLAEIQQASDTTYRVFDFNRKDKTGNLRELHTQMSVDVIDYNKKNDFKINYNKKIDTVNKVVSSPYFITNYIHLTENTEYNLSKRDSFTVYMCVEGFAEIVNDYGSSNVKKGETILLAAQSKKVLIKTSETKLLEVYV